MSLKPPSREHRASASPANPKHRSAATRRLDATSHFLLAEIAVSRHEMSLCDRRLARHRAEMLKGST